MRAICRFWATTLAVWLAAGAFVPEEAQAGVPRSCIHPHFDPIDCARETRTLHRKVLPSARVRALERQRSRLQAPPWVRDQLLEERLVPGSLRERYHRH